jgi:hypothetical protein
LRLICLLSFIFAGFGSLSIAFLASETPSFENHAGFTIISVDLTFIISIGKLTLQLYQHCRLKFKVLGRHPIHSN